MSRELVIVVLLTNVALFLLSIAAHATTYFGIDPQAEYPLVWLLHVGVFLIFIPLLVIHKKETGGRFGKIEHSLVMEYAPEWMRVVFIVLTVYTAMNFALCFILLEEGSPDIWDGRYVLQNHGEFIKEVSQEAYQRFVSYEIRLFSGHWIVFYFYPIMGYCSYLSKEETEYEEL